LQWLCSWSYCWFMEQVKILSINNCQKT